jgi:hypothetical protein
VTENVAALPEVTVCELGCVVMVGAETVLELELEVELSSSLLPPHADSIAPPTDSSRITARCVEVRLRRAFMFSLPIQARQADAAVSRQCKRDRNKLRIYRTRVSAMTQVQCADALVHALAIPPMVRASLVASARERAPHRPDRPEMF